MPILLIDRLRNPGNAYQLHFLAKQSATYNNIPLHPIGPRRRSEGCIAIASPAQFKQLSTYLRRTGPTLAVPGTTVKAYGTVEVR